MKKIKNRILSFLLIALLGLNLSGCSEAMELVSEELQAEILTEAEQLLEKALVSEESFIEGEKEEAWEQESDVLLESEEVQENGSLQESEEVQENETFQDTDSQEEELQVVIDGEYTSKEEVALYIHLYEQLPGNYISKKEAQELGWNSKEGNLWDVAPGMSIGGSYFGNYEGLLPEKDGRKYYECDIDYDGGYRGAKRIIYSNDGLIFYTDDHYESFEQLY